jgi:hypothetical protein
MNIKTINKTDMSALRGGGDVGPIYLPAPREVTNAAGKRKAQSFNLTSPGLCTCGGNGLHSHVRSSA